MDIDIIMSWPLNKIYEYMAFYISETEEFQERVKDDNLTPEQKQQRILRFLTGGAAK